MCTLKCSKCQEILVNVDGYYFCSKTTQNKSFSSVEDEVG